MFADLPFEVQEQTCEAYRKFKQDSSYPKWLNHPQADFTSAVSYVLQKNIELYQR